MVSIGSFSSYDHFAKAELGAGAISNDSCSDLFKKDLEVIQDFTTRVVPGLLSDIFCFFNSAVQVPLYSDRKQFGRNFELTDDNYPDGKKLTYEDCSVILESENPFPESKTKFVLNDFKYYTIRLDADTSFLGQPRTIFIRGALTPEGKYYKEGIEQFSYTNFTDDGIEDGIVLYTNSEEYLEHEFRDQVPQDHKFRGGAFILDIDRPFASFPEDEHAKQILLLKSGFAMRTV